jgi:hypothetical protein
LFNGFNHICTFLADDIYEAAKKANNPNYAPLYANHGLRLIKQSHQPVAEIVEELVSETRQAIRDLNNL